MKIINSGLYDAELKYISFLATSHGMRILVPQPGMNLSPLQWKRKALTTGPPGNSRFIFHLEVPDIILRAL